MGRDIPVGAFNINHPKNCVSGWYRKRFAYKPSRDAEEASSLIIRLCNSQTIVITGGPLKNIGRVVRTILADNTIEFSPLRIVMQGGFAGCNIVPDEILPVKFQGKTSCPSWNLDGDIQVSDAN